MDTRWRSRAVIVVWFILLLFGLSGISFVISYSGSYIHSDYFQNPRFQNVINEFATNLSRFEFDEMTLQAAKNAIVVTDEDINNYKNSQVSLTSQISNLNAEFDNLILEATAHDNEAVASLYIKERDKRIDQLTKQIMDEEYIEEQVRQEKEKEINQRFEEREQYRRHYWEYKESLQYFFTDTVTGKQYTNMNVTEDEAATDPGMNGKWFYKKDYLLSGEHVKMNSLSSSTHSTVAYNPVKGWIGVADPLSSSNMFLHEYQLYKRQQIKLIVYGLASIGALALCFYIRKKKAIPAAPELWRAYYSKVPIDLRVILFIITAILAWNYIDYVKEKLFSETVSILVYFWNIAKYLLSGAVIWGLAFIQAELLFKELRHKDNRLEAWRKALLSWGGIGTKKFLLKAMSTLKNTFLQRSVGVQLMLIFTAVFILGATTAKLLSDADFFPIYLFILLLIGVPVFILFIKGVSYFNLIFIATNELAVGDLERELSVPGKSFLAVLAQNINGLKQGVKTSLNEQAKSERLKTELITNVSHDLRTPLTSIITYTDLLKMEGTTEEDKLAYLEIIDRKSKRLKVLIDDLFEVSKMASGNVDLELETVDLVQLLQQTLAEHEVAMNNSSLQFRISYAEAPVYALVDGKKLWRVFDNLIENVLKYALDNSRVYIVVRTDRNQAFIEFKNVSKFELSENIDELFERFKRGDTARQTEGSGLGLAISKSIVDLHNGSLKLETDGDLFKVSIVLKRYDEK